MSFNLTAILPSIGHYHTSDYKGSEPLPSFDQIGKILERWKGEIFELFCTNEAFEKIKTTNQVSLKENAEVENFSQTIAAIHNVAYQSLSNNTIPVAEDHQKIQEIFQNFLNTLEEVDELKIDIVKLTQTPKFVMKCSEEFLKYAAKTIGKPDEFNYKPDTFLNKCPDLNDFKIFSAIKHWFSLYQSSDATQIASTAKYILDKIKKANSYKTYLTDEEVASIRDHFAKLYSHLEDLQTGYLLKSSKDQAIDAVNVCNKKILENQALANEIQKNLICSKQSVEEIIQTVNKSPSLKVPLANELETRQHTLEEIENQMRLSQDEKDKLLEEAKSLKNEHQEFTNLFQKRSPVAEKDAQLVVQDTTFEMVTILKDHIPLLILCMEDYLQFENAKSQREVSPPSLLGKLCSWI